MRAVDPTVDTFVYAKTIGQFERDLIGALATVIPSGCMEICRCLEDLPARLRTPHYQSTILVLIAADEADLKDILSIQTLLNGTRIILVLPDSSTAAAMSGHPLRPRFTTHRGNGFQEVVDVVEKMIAGNTIKTS
jgi:hypothetical protein